MLELKFKGITIAFNFSFFAAVTLLTLLKDNNYAFWGLSACLWHELGHFIVMHIFEIPVKNVIFYGAGIKIIPDKQIDFTSFGKLLAVYFAGSIFNFAAAAIVCLNGNLKILGTINAVIGIFNLLPLQYLDGGKILVALIYKLCSFSIACQLERYIKWANVFLIAVTIIIFIIVGGGNFTLYITLCCLLVSAFSY